jgi:hypothetical protein
MGVNFKMPITVLRSAAWCPVCHCRVASKDFPVVDPISETLMYLCPDTDQCEIYWRRYLFSYYRSVMYSPS